MTTQQPSPRQRCTTTTGNRGFTYLALMFSITLIGITLTAAARPWKMVSQREREADLLAYGIEIQQAIGAYSTKMKAGRVLPGEVYPQTLDELTRQPVPLLRKVYRDPITQGPFDLVRAPTGGIMGVRSRSTVKPIRQHEFPAAVRHFDNLSKYRDWIFQHPNASGSTFSFPGLSAAGQPGHMMPGTIPPATPGPGSTPDPNLPGVQSGPSMSKMVPGTDNPPSLQPQPAEPQPPPAPGGF